MKRPSSLPPKADFTIPQDWDDYTADEHARWGMLYTRQLTRLQNRVCDEFLAGLEALNLNDGGIPDFTRVNEKLEKLTGWNVVAVPHLVPDDIFFEHLANRRLPSGCFIRGPESLDYIEEPDVFHDLFGHVPLLVNPVFADYMQAFGRGERAARGLNALKILARLYWYTTEYGLIETPKGLRIYGSGIVSSYGETPFALESDLPNRIAFDLARVAQTDYRIDAFQQSYFVIESFAAMQRDTSGDLSAIYRMVSGLSAISPGAVLGTDRVLHRGTQSYAVRCSAA